MQQYLNMEERIQAYINGECNDADRITVEHKIAGDKVWREQYQAMLSVHELLLSGLEPMEPSMRFSKNVMDEIAGLTIARPARQFINPWIFRITGGILGTFLLAILVYSFSLADFSSGASDTKLPALPTIQVPEVNWTNFLGQGTTLMLFMVCTILGLYIADKLLGKKLLNHP
jgi:hypothetical protein